MSKNLIVCADGTGNRGGSTPDSNVYTIYKAIDIHVDGQDGSEVTEQRRFYDNGVGTSKNKIWRALTGAVGIGFKDNVRDVYRFLARNYERNDHIYIFGFSRGAATVRALNGFIYAAGLVKRSVNGKTLSDTELEEAIKGAFNEYKKQQPASPMEADASSTNHGAVPIEFIGVWDTVSALGFPDRWGVVPGLLSPVLNTVFNGLEHVANVFFPHLFYNYELTPNVRHACQALAIDDERLSFSPLVWNEKQYSAALKASERTGQVEQVWFAGAHSNVGGGYGRSGLANVSLEWMMERADETHLAFVRGAVERAHDEANAHGRLFDSRDGFAVFYRYHPRNIEQLCDHRAPVRIHSSVFERMDHATAGYAPGNLPSAVTVVGTGIDSPKTEIPFQSVIDGWSRMKGRIALWTLGRKWLYGILLDVTLLVIGFSIWSWTIGSPTELATVTGVPGHVARGVAYVTPKFMENTIVYVVVEEGRVGLTIMGVALFLLFARWFIHGKHATARTEMRNVLVGVLPPTMVDDGHGHGRLQDKPSVHGQGDEDHGAPASADDPDDPVDPLDKVVEKA